MLVVLEDLGGVKMGRDNTCNMIPGKQLCVPKPTFHASSQRPEVQF